MSTRVTKIIGVGYEIKNTPPQLIVRVKGEVPTLGWANTVLHRRVYNEPPNDGVWEYDLYADRPTGEVLGQKVSTVEATDVWDNYDEQHVRGVRIYGESNGIFEKIFGQESTPQGFKTEL